MKRSIFSIVFLFLLCGGCIFANEAKLFSVDSEVYKNISYLYILTGHGMPNSAGPWSQEELIVMAQQLPETYENVYCQKLYDKVMEALSEHGNFHTKDGFDFGLHGKINPELYVHSNELFDDETDWFYDYEKRQELLEAEAEGWFSNFIYSDLKFQLGFSSGYVADADDNVFFTNYVDSNIPYATGHTLADLTSSFPQRAIIALGGDHWNFSAGRDVVRWGNGETGNLLLGGNFEYDNVVRFATFYKPFKFSFVSLFYPHPYDVKNVTTQWDLVNGVLMFLGHRLDFRFFKDKMSLSLSEAIMYQSSTYEGVASSTLDIRVFNPVNLYHSLFMRSNCNSIMAVDFDYTVIPCLNLYSQFVLDELAFIGEPTGTSEGGGRPDKMGFMLGAKYTLAAPAGLFKFSAEGVYTDPCLYLREEYDEGSGTNGVSFYGTYREFQNGASAYNGNSVSYLRQCIGYAYGGDAVVGDLKASFDPLKNYVLGTELFFMAHGIMYNDLAPSDEGDWTCEKKTFAPSTENTLVDTGNNEDGYVEYFIRFSLNGSYNIKKWWQVYARLDNWIVINKDNNEASPVYDTQFILGTAFKL